MSHEIELKLSLPRAVLPALRCHPLITAAVKQGKAVTLDNTYYDTPELDLKKHKIAVRTRRYGRTSLQTVKCAATSAGGLSQRPEWEQPFKDAFDFSTVSLPKVRKFLARHAPRLTPVFSTRFRRETRLYAPSESVRILMMIDTGEIIVGDQRAPICELELELETGSARDLLELARQLSTDLPLWPEDISKAERGFRLHLGHAATPMPAEDSGIAGDNSPMAAFTHLALSCVRQWQANAAGATVSDDPEFLHQLRVALRRLRTLIAVFAPALPAAFVSEWKERLAENAKCLGQARDLDVLIDEILNPIASEINAGPSLPDLIKAAETSRAQARKTARQHLDPAIQGQLLIAFMCDLHTLPSVADGDGTVASFAPLRLKRLQDKVARSLEAAVNCAPEPLHALRITLKRFRYGIEFFAPLMPRKAVTRYRQAIVRAQDALGFINDVDIANSTLNTWAGADPERRVAAAFVRGWHGPRYARLARRSVRELSKLLRVQPPWQA